jgi:hypothetical protein
VSLFERYLRNQPFTKADKAEALAAFRECSDDELWLDRRQLGEEWDTAVRRFPDLRPDERHGNHPQEYRMRTLEILGSLMDSVLVERGLHTAELPNEDVNSAASPVDAPATEAAHSQSVDASISALLTKTPTESGQSTRVDTAESCGPGKPYKTALGRNIDRFKSECGWSFDELAKASELDKKLILGHVNQGKGTHPSTLKRYADVFSKKLGRSVTVAELKS